jgi:hypothetical protein
VWVRDPLSGTEEKGEAAVTDALTPQEVDARKAEFRDINLG